MGSIATIDLVAAAPLRCNPSVLRAGYRLALILTLGCSPREAEVPSSSALEPASTAPAPRPVASLGVRLRNPSLQERRDLGLETDETAVLVADVLSGGPAARARLKPGDWITSLEDKPSVQVCAFQAELMKRAPGESVRIAIRRGNATFEPTLTLAEAVDLHARSCEAGEPAGCQLLAASEAHPERALELFEKACQLGLAEGCVGVGDALVKGSVAPADKARGRRLFERACRAGSASGCTFAAFPYATGEGVERDDFRATEFYQRACDGGDPVGCYNLGLMFEKGRGTVRNPAQARDAYAIGCAGGYPLACTNLGYMVEHGVAGNQDESRAAKLYRRACEGGCADRDPTGCLNFGIFLRHGWGVPEDKLQALSLFELSCQAGMAEACERLGTMLAAGEGVPRDEARAAAAFQSACDAGSHPEACAKAARLKRR